jgi:hypothetical protein
MTLAQSHAIGDFTTREFRSEILLYVLKSPLGLPSRKTPAPRNASQPRHPSEDCIEFSAEECLIPQAARSYLATRIKQCHKSHHRMPDPRQGRCTRIQPPPRLGRDCCPS